MKKLFISYRRQDSGGVAGRLYDRLSEVRARMSVFMDVDAIKAGENFEDRMLAAVAESDLVLVVIGKNWFGSAGKNRILQADDPVRCEVAMALAQRKKIIPLLINGATMPSKEALPEELQELRKLNAVFIRHESFEADLTVLKGALGIKDEPKKQHCLGWTAAGTVCGTVLFLAVAVLARLLTGHSLAVTLGSVSAVWALLVVLLVIGGLAGFRHCSVRK